ncbi:HNH endonuclease [Deinococcus murrayi]|uniref:HNH endonuclease n=1 Tax=Deinococcus murrayi TaxID=68910 RepID=UPI0006866BC4|nr:HNH endonuclease [Deinococcus murrayi]
MAEIALVGKRGAGKVALCDDADFARLSQYRWHLDRDGYPRTFLPAELGQRRRKTGMHQLLTDARGGYFSDHINGNPLDNRRSNLRPCTRTENNRNRAAFRRSKTGLKGVSPWRGGFRAVIHDGRTQIFLGCFPTKELAAAAYNGAARVLHGKFARFNPIPLTASEVAHAAD